MSFYISLKPLLLNKTPCCAYELWVNKEMCLQARDHELESQAVEVLPGRNVKTRFIPLKQRLTIF